MNLLFFQNCVSPHQVPYMVELVKFNIFKDIILIVPRYDYDERRKIGWNNENLIDKTGIQLIFKPNDIEVEDLLKNCDNGYCFFSGIRADKSVFNWFKLSLDYGVKRYIITEPPLTYNKPLWLHYIRFYLRDYRFVSCIDGIFGIGYNAVKYYKCISSKWDVFPFMYVTEPINRTEAVPHGVPKMLFVGNLCKRKNVAIVIKVLKEIKNVEFSIVGNGKQKKNLERLAKKLRVKVNFEGARNIKEVPVIMQGYDVLVLPSLYDGWGVVVNEAMGLGLYVVVSDKCGARQLINSKKQGIIFKSNKISDLKNAISYCINNIDSIRENIYINIRDYKKYRPENVAKYLINCINSKSDCQYDIFNNKGI